MSSIDFLLSWHPILILYEKLNMQRLLFAVSFLQISGFGIRITSWQTYTEFVAFCVKHRLWLQTGTQGAFGKPQGTMARAHIGQVIMSIRTKLQNKEHVIEALRRAKFKVPGRQKIHISKKWGFTKFNADEFEDMVAEKRLIPDSCGAKYIPNCGPLDKWLALHS
ncbi:large ribosomal subunit protein uL16-like [Erinaceus europaeus]|uniref:Large ribosomal subunit protein uL16-like n=1 Tax=Erinaceus europaeus TaxID=9365 RepID=A0A1S3AQY9_ERIEU|nr:large ribosomal subunit protein uL16-like [Erinaceus europaeus]